MIMTLPNHTGIYASEGEWDRATETPGEDDIVESKWMYRAMLMSCVLEDLGYSTANIMNADKEILVGYIDEEASDLIYKLQMKGG